MRANAAAGRGVAHHDIVEAGLRNEGKAPQQRIGSAVVKVHSADEKRPAALYRRNGAERTVHCVTAPAFALHDARFDVVALRKCE